MGRALKKYPWSTLGALLALLGYICLPLIYYHHPSRFSLVAVSWNPGTGPPPSVSQSETPHWPFHNNKTRPICQGPNNLQDCGHLPSRPMAGGPSLSGFFYLNHRAPAVSFVILPISSPRDPPTSL